MPFSDTPLVIQPGNTHQASVIWLHGLGADGNDFAPIIPELGLPEDAGIKFIFPHAPKRAISINGGMVMRGWYDIRAMDLTISEDEAGIVESSSLLLELIDAEAELLGSERVVLAGFSQGGAMILHTGLRYTRPLAGLLALSTYLPLADKLSAEKQEANQETPILMMHGTYDPVIPIMTADRSGKILQEQGYDVEWQQYMMQHSVCPEQIDKIGVWLKQRLLS